MANVTWRPVGALLKLNVFRDIDNDWTWAAGCRDVERLVQHAGKIIYIAHQPIMLGARPCDPNRIAFLKCVIANKVGCHLAGDNDQRYRIHQCIG